MKKLCIFDLDGTLSNTLPTIAYYGNLALGKYSHPAIEQERYKTLVGDGRDILIHRMLAESGADTPEEYERVGSAYDAAYEADVLYLTQPYDGITEMLKTLKIRGFCLAVLSNKPHNVAEMVVQKLFGGIFDEVWGKKEGFPTKPDPAAAHEICRRLGVNPADAFFIGDTSVDIKTGKNGGFTSIGVLWGFRGKEELCRAGADFTVSHPKEIPDVVLAKSKMKIKISEEKRRF